MPRALARECCLLSAVCCLCKGTESVPPAPLFSKCKKIGPSVLWWNVRAWEHENMGVEVWEDTALHAAAHSHDTNPGIVPT